MSFGDTAAAGDAEIFSITLGRLEVGEQIVADTGSTNGTHINGVRIPYGEARPISDGDVVAFGEVEVRFRRVDS